MSDTHQLAGEHTMTVNELRHLLFYINNQDAQVVVMVNGTPLAISDLCPSDDVDEAVYVLIT